MLYSCVILCIALYLIIIAYIKLFHRFWSVQPVFHVYNIYYWLIYNGIIETEQQPPTKYYDPSVETTYYEDTKVDISKLLQQHYLQDENIQYYPMPSNIDPYFKNNKYSLYSLYYTDIVNANLTPTKQLVACITGRKVHVSCKDNTFTCYYIDYLCVHKHYRKQGIAQKMIQSHEYNQRATTHNPISLFKREASLNLMVPVVTYFTYGFNMYSWNKPTESVNIVKVGKLMIQNIYEIIAASAFKVKIWMDEHVLLDLLKEDNIYVYALIVYNRISAVYFLRDGNTQYNKKKTIDLIGSINVGVDNSVFVAGFMSVMSLLQDKYKFIWIENLSHNQYILDYILLKNKYDTRCPMAYYFYNYAIKPCRETDIIILI